MHNLKIRRQWIHSTTSMYLVPTKHQALVLELEIQQRMGERKCPLPCDVLSSGMC